MRRFALVISLLVFFSLNAFVLAAQATDEKVVKIGVLSFRPPATMLEQWQPTADYLSDSIEGYRFEIVPLNYPNLESAVAKAEIDFVTTNPAHYAVFEALYGVTKISTLIRTENNNPAATLGGVIFSKSSRNDIGSLVDLKGKKVAGVQADALGGYVAQMYELKNVGVTKSDFGSFIFTGQPHDKVVYLVQSGKIDVGMIRTGVLEWMAKEGKIKLSDFKVISQKMDKSYPYLLSTKLYPEWPFAKLKHTSNELSSQVLITLLDINRKSEAAAKGGYSGWTIPLDYEPVHELLKALKMRPYENVSISTQEMFEAFWPWLLGAWALVVALSLFIYNENRINSKLKETQAQTKKAIESLKRAEKIAKIGNWTLDLAANKLEWSDEIFNLFEIDKERFAASYDAFLNAIHPDDRDAVNAAYSNSLITKQKYEIEHRLLMEDGRMKHVREQCETDFDENGNPLRSIGTVQDITEYRKLQDRLKAFNEELEQKVAAGIEELRQKDKILTQQSKMAAMGEMIGAIAHQWRQPLSSLGIVVQDVHAAYKYGELNESYILKFQQQAMSTIKRMSKTIDDFKNFFSPNKQEEQFFVEDSIDEMLQILTPQLKSNNIEVLFDADALNKHIYVGYKNELKQVLLNIFANAKDALLETKPHRAFIKIEIKTVENAIKISIEDSAGGVRPDIMDKIFEPYFTTKPENTGTGIGLYMSKQIVEESMNGKLSVENTENGAKFTISLSKKDA